MNIVDYIDSANVWWWICFIFFYFFVNKIQKFCAIIEAGDFTVVINELKYDVYCGVKCIIPLFSDFKPSTLLKTELEQPQ